MKQRVFGNTGRQVSEIGLGTWQLGTRWGESFNEAEAQRILAAAKAEGITLIDTADVYNGGQSEEAIGRFIKTQGKDFFVVTKCGRKLNPHTADMYTPDAITEFVEGSLRRMQLEKLDMVLLHCPPSPVFRKDEVFARLEQLKREGKLLSYGVSIEKVEEGLDALKYGISAIEVIYNMFRLKPEEQLFPAAVRQGVGIIARVPLASGLLSGRFSADTQFGAKDHRSFNREGASFDKGETFSGVPYGLGLEAVEELKQLFGTQELAPFALRWVLMNKAVSVVIPGASRTEQLLANVRAAKLPELSEAQMQGVRDIYERLLRKEIHPQW